MSCNGCRVLRKGCSENCMLRQCLHCIDTPQAQAHATLFVAKFFGRAGLLSFISAVPLSQRPTLFRSLLFEAVGRTISPVNGAVGLLWSGNWRVCQAAVETVLRGGTIQALPKLVGGSSEPDSDAGSEAGDNYRSGPAMKRKKVNYDDVAFDRKTANLELNLTSGSTERQCYYKVGEKRRSTTPFSEESETTMLGSVSVDDCRLQKSQRSEAQAEGNEGKLLRLFF